MHIRCPLCKAELEAPDGYAYRPFCSERCKLLDLERWLDGSYCLPRPLTEADLDGLSEAELAELAGQPTSPPSEQEQP